MKTNGTNGSHGPSREELVDLAALLALNEERVQEARAQRIREQGMPLTEDQRKARVDLARAIMEAAFGHLERLGVVVKLRYGAYYREISTKRLFYYERDSGLGRAHATGALPRAFSS